MTTHLHCPSCEAMLVHCSACSTDFVVEPLDGADQIWNGEELARNAAVWHTYLEHREDWNMIVGHREPSEPQFASVKPS